MKRYQTVEIPPSSYFTMPVYLDPRFVLTAPETPFSPELARALAEWDYMEVSSDGEPCEQYTPDEAETYKNVMGHHETIADMDKVQNAERFYVTFRQYVESLFAQAAFEGELDFKAIAEKMRNACETIREERRYLLRVHLPADQSSDEDYNIAHTARSTILSIIIGASLKLPNHRLIELGVAALLHEIGMIKLPAKSYHGSRTLTEDEKKLMYTHPIQGYQFLKSSNFPLVISLAVLEHHERENGTGYPQGLSGDKISLYAKIIAVACSYEALSSHRPHKDAKDGYTGMLELLKNEGRQYDENVIRALVYTLSIYPIGLYVLLSSGKKGQVVDVNAENPRFPVVQIFGELMPDGKNRITQTSADGISIVRPLTSEEING